MERFPFIDNLEMWADPLEQKYTNIHEKSIFEMRAWPKSQKTYETEGYIKFERLRPHDCLFNSRFESGNLRQVFKVPMEIDMDWIPVDEKIPDYLPDEIQEEKRAMNKKIRHESMQKISENHEEEEKEDLR